MSAPRNIKLVREYGTPFGITLEGEAPVQASYSLFSDASFSFIMKSDHRIPHIQAKLLFR